MSVDLAHSLGVRTLFSVSRAASSYLVAAIGAAMLIGAVLRLAGANGDLWFDEIWTLKLVSSANSVGDILFHTPYDNNHFSNSVWMWAVGPHASPVALRALAIVLGAMTIPAAAMACRGHSDAAAIVAALTFAISYFFVHYGSEARGYSAMILSIVVAKAALDQIIEGPTSRTPWVIFFGAIAFGVFSHITMLEGAAALGLAGLAQAAAAGRLRLGVAVAAVAVAGVLPGLAIFLANFLSPNFHTGMGAHFTYDLFFQGLAGAARTSLGAPEWLDDVSCVALVVIAVLGALWLVPAQRRWFPVVAIFVLPALHVIGGLPNQFYPRFHLTTTVALALLMGEAVAALWLRGGAYRALAGLAAAGFLVSQTAMLTNFLAIGRGGYTAAARFMTQDGPAAYTNDRLVGETNLVLNYV
ncbi:MAG: hypothetical protein N2444_06805, partial [Methylocystis sp.]|nr:hypothetical protein [Methylocystis sp.]